MENLGFASITNSIKEEVNDGKETESGSKSGDLNHGLAEDLNQRLALKAGRSETGGYDADDTAPEPPGSAEVIGAGTNCHRNRRTGEEAVHDPRLSGGTRRRRRSCLTQRHGTPFHNLHGRNS